MFYRNAFVVSILAAFKSAAVHLNSRLRFGCLAVVIFTAGCDTFTPAPVEFSTEDVVAIGDIHTIEIRDRVVASLPTVKPDISLEKARLGRQLFWDPILSGDQDIACATCHLPSHGYGDNRARSIGTGGTGRGPDRTQGTINQVPRNAQTVLNVVWNGINEAGLFDTQTAPMFWDNRTSGLANQALDPIKSKAEMRGNNFNEDEIVPQILMRLNSTPEYVNLFAEAYRSSTISEVELADALASFQSTLVANNAPFDQWMRGDDTAMSQRQLSGLQEFVIAGCAECHSGPMFSDFELHVLGTQEAVGLVEPDAGDGEFAFRTPTLRQLQFTAPYFHGGQFNTLDDVIEFYDEPENSSNLNVSRGDLDRDFLALPETDGELGDLLIEFLSTLNDPDFDQSVPDNVPSGLIPGGQ